MKSKSQTNITFGYLIFAFFFSVMFSLYFQDPMYYAFTLFLVMALVLATAIDVGDVNKDLAEVGWSSTNINSAIPLGILGGIVSLLIGSFLVNIDVMRLLVPDLTSIVKLFTTASIIPPLWSLSANLFAQWLVIAPSEESLKLIIAPYGGIKIFNNKIIAFFIAIIMWIAMHIPTFIMQGAGSNMYIVLFILGIITAGLFFMTNSILSPIIAHGTFNSVIILSSSDVYGKLVVIIIMVVLVLVWLKNSKKTRG